MWKPVTHSFLPQLQERTASIFHGGRRASVFRPFEVTPSASRNSVLAAGTPQKGGTPQRKFSKQKFHHFAALTLLLAPESVRAPVESAATGHHCVLASCADTSNTPEP